MRCRRVERPRTSDSHHLAHDRAVPPTTHGRNRRSATTASGRSAPQVRMGRRPRCARDRVARRARDAALRAIASGEHRARDYPGGGRYGGDGATPHLGWTASRIPGACLKSCRCQPPRWLAPFSGKRRTTGMREGNERVLHRRSSESRWPRPCVGDPRGRSEALDRGARRPAIEPRNWACPGCRRARKRRKAITLAAFSRAVSGPRGVEEPVHACELSMLRTGRSHDHPPVVMEGRVVRGRPRP
jgi:hypothetical protein